MEAQQILNRLTKRGITFRVFAGELQWAVNEHVVTRADFAELVKVMPDVIAIVRQRAQGAQAA